MKLNIFNKNQVKTNKSVSDYRQDLVIKQGREQFKKMMEKGIRIPVVFL